MLLLNLVDSIVVGVSYHRFFLKTTQIYRARNTFIVLVSSTVFGLPFARVSSILAAWWPLQVQEAHSWGAGTATAI